MWRLKRQAFGDLMASGKNITDEEGNHIMDALPECLVHFSQSTKQGQQDAQSLQASLTIFQRSLELLSPYLQIFDEFVTARSETAAFWNLYLKMVQLYLDYVSVERDSNILLQMETFSEMLPFDFICNHKNYARWGSVYIAEMNKLQIEHPDLFQNFSGGYHTIHKADKDESKFSGVWSDMSIEQSINRVCGKLGGLNNIKTKESAMEKWYLTAHLKANVATQFLKYSGLDLAADKSPIHKEATDNRIQQDENAVADVIKTIEDRMINPFSVSSESTPEDPQPLSSISTGIVATDEISKWVKGIEDQGEKQLREFVKKRIQLQEVDIFDPITKNKVSNFSLLRNKAKVKKDGNVTTLDIDRKIFSKLIVVSQTRDFDLQKLFEFELSSVPLALFNPDGSMRKCTKSELLKEIESGLAVEEIDIVPGSSAVIIDFMVLVRMVCTDTSKCKIFGELSLTLLSMIFGMYTVASRMDLVYDRYDLSDSIKAAKRSRRGTVDIQEIAIHNENTPLPKQRIKMLSNSRNKANIVEFLYKH